MFDAVSQPTASTSRRFAPWARRCAERFIGIDIGVDRVHIACMTAQDAQDPSRFQWDSRCEFALPVDPTRPPTPNLVDTICQTLVDKLPRCVDGEVNATALSLPLSWIHYEISGDGDRQTSQANCDAMFRASVFQSDAHVCSWPVWPQKPQQVIAATSENAACQIAEILCRSGYRIKHILPHGAALICSAKALTGISPSAVAVLETYGGVVAAATQRDGSEDVPEDHCGLCRPLPAFTLPSDGLAGIDQFEPWLETIADEINATLRYSGRASNTSVQAKPVLICGTVAETEGVDAVLATQLGRPVAVWRYASRKRPIGALDPQEMPSYHDPSRAIAVSLAHRAAFLETSGRS